MGFCAQAPSRGRCGRARRGLAPWLGVLGLACASPSPPAELRVSRPAMGTLLEIVVRTSSQPDARRWIDEAFREVERLEALLSEWRETSEISRLNRRAGGELIDISRETEEILRLAQELSLRTGGAFDPTVLPLVRLHGFFGGERDPQDPPSAERIETLRRRVGRGALELHAGRARLRESGVEIGLGAIAKGYIAERALQVLRSRGAEAALVNAGGDLVAFDAAGRGFPVQIEWPERPGEAFAEIVLRDGALATSAVTWGSRGPGGAPLHHVIDPRSGRPARGALSATVLAGSGADADALATACLVLGAEAPALIEGMRGVEALLVLSDGRRWVSPGLVGRVRWLLPWREPGLVEGQRDQEEHAGVEAD